MKKIVMLMPYFGAWPEWINFTLLSCSYNPTIDWVFFTDCGIPQVTSSNLKFVSMSFKEMKALVHQKIGVKIETDHPYKVCDIRPAFGEIFDQYIKGYDYFGYGDLDVIFGNLRHFLTEDVLKYDLLSFRPHIISGHFALFKNDKQMIQKYRQIKNWKEKMGAPESLILDEEAFYWCINKKQRFGWVRCLTRLCAVIRNKWTRFVSKLEFQNKKNQEAASGKIRTSFYPATPKIYQKKYYFVESYCAPMTMDITWKDGSFLHPDEWFWKDGHLTNSKDTGESMYLHFLYWKGGKGNKGGWKCFEHNRIFINCSQKKMLQGFKINEKGFFNI